MNNKFTIPGAIVIAGVLIAGAILLNSKSTRSSTVASTSTGPSEVTVSVNKVNLQDHILGNPESDAIVIEFSDPECPFCKQFHITMNTIMDNLGKEGKVAWVYRHFPIVQLHSKAPKEAEALECAYDQGGNDKFWEYTDALYDLTPSNNGLDLSELPKIAQSVDLDVTKFEECLESGKYTQKVQNDYNDAITSGGRGTPFSVVVLKQKLSTESLNALEAISEQLPAKTIVVSSDGKSFSISGALPYELMNELLNLALTH